MTTKEIEKIEKEPLFKIFLRRIGFKDFYDYLNLFGDDREKREETCRRFLKTYPNYNI